MLATIQKDQAIERRRESLAPLVLAGVRQVFGESRLAIRFLPFLAGGATAFLGRLLARRLRRWIVRDRTDYYRHLGWSLT